MTNQRLPKPRAIRIKDYDVDVYVPTLTLAEFFAQLQPPLNKRAEKILKDEGFETAAALLGASTISLSEVGLKAGDISQLAAALKQRLQENQHQPREVGTSKALQVCGVVVGFALTTVFAVALKASLVVD